MTNDPARLRFNGFEFDSERLALYHNEEIVRVEPKSLEVLAVLTRSANSLVRTEEIIDEVWGDSPHGITPMHVSQAVGKLRKAFSAIDPETTFIETVTRSGYIFRPKIESNVTAHTAVSELPPTFTEPQRSTEQSRLSRITLAVALLLGLAFVAAWILYPSRDDVAEIRSVVEESQKWESLVLYRDPTSFLESDLDKYWMTETDSGSKYDRRSVRTGAQNLISKGLHYGAESKNEQFEFQSIEVNTEGNMAVVKTLEKWFLAEYRKDGTIHRNKTVGPYFVSYVLRKVDNRWLIEGSTTARATPPAATITSVLPSEPLSSGKQGFVTIEGSGFVPQTVYLRVTGPGCPADNPCSVPNSALRLHSELSETKLSKVPVTLASGEFAISVVNGESPPSNATNLTIP